MSGPDKLKMCHRTGFALSCRDLQDEKKCQGRWVNTVGRNPNTGETINRFGCVDDEAQMLSLVFEERLLGIQAAIESSRNEQVKMATEAIARTQIQHDQAMGFVISHQDRARLDQDPRAVLGLIHDTMTNGVDPE